MFFRNSSVLMPNFGLNILLFFPILILDQHISLSYWFQLTRGPICDDNMCRWPPGPLPSNQYRALDTQRPGQSHDGLERLELDTGNPSILCHSTSQAFSPFSLSPISIEESRILTSPWMFKSLSGTGYPGLRNAWRRPLIFEVLNIHWFWTSRLFGFGKCELNIGLANRYPEQPINLGMVCMFTEALEGPL
jgi:hypothetical protein